MRQVLCIAVMTYTLLFFMTFLIVGMTESLHLFLFLMLFLRLFFFCLCILSYFNVLPFPNLLLLVTSVCVCFLMKDILGVDPDERGGEEELRLEGRKMITGIYYIRKTSYFK